VGPHRHQHPDAVAAAQDAQGAARLTVAAVAHRLGVAPGTLRTWDRRYGLGPSEHTAGSHRRYSAADVVRLELMRRLTLDGVGPAEAARVALTAAPAPVAPAASAGSGPLATHPPVAGPLPDREGRLRPGSPGSLGGPGGPGGKVLAMPGADAVARGVGRAAMALDSGAVTAIVRAELAAYGVVHTWEHVLVPVLVAAGNRWAATGEGVEVEHLLSECIVAALRQHAGADAIEPARPVLLACAPNDQHVLPLQILAAGLAERGMAARVLGPALPIDALHSAVRRIGPSVLFLWAQLRTSADVSVLASLPVTRPATAVVVGGPGWDVAELPQRVTAAGDLAGALTLVGQALGR
jgi:transposase-like protein